VIDGREAFGSLNNGLAFAIRSTARAGLRQAAKRAFGQSWWANAAKSAWPNDDSCSGLVSAASLATAGARNAVNNHPFPLRCLRVAIRAVAIVPPSRPSP